MRVKVQRLRNKAGESRDCYEDRTLDGSGWSPWSLERLLDLAARLPYEEAAVVAQGFGLAVSRADLERLCAGYARAVEGEVEQQLLAQALEPLAAASPGDAASDARVMVLQMDGVRVMGQADPQQHLCSGVEIKCALVYPQNSPSQRTRWAGVREAGDCLALVSGLVRQAGVKTGETLVAVSDGAVWIEHLCQSLGIPQVIDVFHASQYLETVLLQLGWSEAERQAERAIWLRGEVNASAWLQTYCPPPAAPQRQGWSGEAKTAIEYLEQRSNRMNYKDYKALNWPIGSGQVEGMNKHVIGSRMKRSGMQWSRSGASRMAALRVETCARPEHKITDFKTLRFSAFPVHHS